MKECLQVRIHGDTALPALVYLPGMHGDWTLVSSFRERMKGSVCFVEFIYPRTLTWTLGDYGAAVATALAEHGIREGILLGESFGSQVAWAMLAALRWTDGEVPFRAFGLILAGGFARYPFPALVDFARLLWRLTPYWLARVFFHGYAVFARWQHRHAPETAAEIREFVSRRTRLDLDAMEHRLKLIRENDPRDVAARTEVPVYQLAGLWDPIVCAPAVNKWLRRWCPGFRQTRIVTVADHNVLGTAPDQSVPVVKSWLAEARALAVRQPM